MAGNSMEAGRSVTHKITAILMTFTEGAEHSLTEITQMTGLPISTTHRLTSELTSWCLLERTPDGRYRAGLSLRLMGAGDVHIPHLRERAPCILEDLVAATRCRARLGVLDDLEVVYIEKRPGLCPVSAFGRRATLPAHATALGRVLLAFAPQSTVELVMMRGLHAYTRSTITAPDRLRRLLAVTRMTQVAVTRFELEADTCAVAVPVFGADNEVLAAIELTVCDLGRRQLPHVIAPLSIAARSLSRELCGGVVPGSDAGGRSGYPTLVETDRILSVAENGRTAPGGSSLEARSA